MTHHTRHPNFTITVSSTDIDGDTLVEVLQTAINAGASNPSDVVQGDKDEVTTVTIVVTAPKATEDEQATYDYLRAALDESDSEATLAADPAL